MSEPTRSEAYWSQTPEALFAALASGPDGLPAAAAAAGLARHGPNSIDTRQRRGPLLLLCRQFTSPLVLILLFGAVVSLLLDQLLDASIILAIVIGGALLGFLQEYRADRAVEALRRRLALTARVLRDGSEVQVPVDQLVPGDVVLLSAGNLVPADGVLLAATDFLVSEASLTGESFPVEKRPGVAPATAGLAARPNTVFAGTSVRSGTARALIVETGAATAVGRIARRAEPEADTDFARGVRRFGGLLLRIMIVIVLFVLTVNQLMGRPVADSLLFAVALAVGLSPELLPAIVSITLSSGARRMARAGVIVRQLEAIENLGSMDVLCTDKTGTLTEGQIRLASATGPTGEESARVRRLAFRNAALETGIANPLDAALVDAGRAAGLGIEGLQKVDEIPYDFQRRCLTIVIVDDEVPGHHRIITKGAFANVLERCGRVAAEAGEAPLDAAWRQRLEANFAAQGAAGFRVLAVAERSLPPRERYHRQDEADLTFCGFLLFLDPPRPEAAATLKDLSDRGIATKVITGDNRYIAAHLAGAVGLDPRALLTGEQIAAMADEALWQAAPRTDLFVEIDPQQKERIVRALQRRGHAVGYIGDGINDVPALGAADVGISVDGAVDVARETASIVLLRHDLAVLSAGVDQGRRTFANTLKYIAITTSANFGNMVSMALATPLLPFLPLLPKQILLNNFLSDLPSIALSGDALDAEAVRRPRRWDIGQIRRFMIFFGLISSLFDLLTFAVLLLLLKAGEAEFQTAWFVVSLLTELVVVLSLRTERPAWRSRPGRLLLWSTLAVAALTLLLPFTPVDRLFGFVAPDAGLMAALVAIVLGYLVTTELGKRWFYRRSAGPPAGGASSTRRSLMARSIRR